MNLIKENTQFIFVMTSKKNLEVRFVDDFKNTGLHYLKHLNFPEDHINIVSDTPKDDFLNKHSLPNTLSYFESSELLNLIKTVECDNLIIVSSCHGSYEGFDSKTIIKPFPFISALKENPYTKNIVVMFGQCYSGIFNYSALDCENKTIVLMGASGMNASASTGLTIQANGQFLSWSGNVAVCYFFEWLYQPKDIDGDNRMTVMDLYKYVSMQVLTTNDKIEHASYADWIKKRIEIEKKIDNTDKADTKALQLLQVELNKNDFDYLLPRQQPWIQNPEGALSISIEYK